MRASVRGSDVSVCVCMLSVCACCVPACLPACYLPACLLACLCVRACVRACVCARARRVRLRVRVRVRGSRAQYVDDLVEGPTLPQTLSHAGV